MNRIVSIVLSAGVVVLALAVTMGVLGLDKLIKSNDAISHQLGDLAETAQQEIQDKIKEDSYQAVFLDGGQVYFGKLTETSGNYFSLTDVFYLRGAQGADELNVGSADNSDISLVKLGNELHGPEDYMYIPKAKVMFVENLKNDADVVKSIKLFKESD